jgi:hypothetical protein
LVAIVVKEADDIRSESLLTLSLGLPDEKDSVVLREGLIIVSPIADCDRSEKEGESLDALYIGFGVDEITSFEEI